MSRVPAPCRPRPSPSVHTAWGSGGCQRCAVAPIAILLRRRHRQARCASSLRSTAPSPAAWSRCSRSPQAPLRWKTRRHNQAREYPVSRTGRCSPAGSQPTIAACRGGRQALSWRALSWQSARASSESRQVRGSMCDRAEKVGVRGPLQVYVCDRGKTRHAAHSARVAARAHTSPFGFASPGAHAVLCNCPM